VDAGFLVLVAITLAFVSLLVVARMKSAGAPNRRAALLLAELWVVFAIWLGVLWAAATKLGVEPGAGGPPEAKTLLRHVAALGGAERALLVLGLLLGIAVFIHLMWALPRAMRNAGGD